jgi:hypothetical protein
MSSLGLLHQVFGPALKRTSGKEGQSKRGGGQEAEDSLQWRPVGEAEKGVPGQQISYGGQAGEPLQGARPQRVPAQDLVPEQARQAQEVPGREGRARQDSREAGPLQSLEFFFMFHTQIYIQLSVISRYLCFFMF